MRAKQYLRRIREIDTAIRIKNEELERIAEKAVSIGSFSEGERVQSSKVISDRMADDVVRYVDMRNEMLFDNLALVKERQSIIQTMSMLPGSEYEVLYYRYAKDKNFDEIADIKDRSRRWVIDKHARGVKNLQKILDEVNNERELS